MRKPSLYIRFPIGIVATGLLCAPQPARCLDSFLTRDLGIHGMSHLCKYSDGRVYAFGALQLCPLSINDDDGAPGTSPPAIPGAGARDGDISLFDSTGKPVAYIDTGDDMTIYLWGGRPVAYLDGDGSGQYDVYGFNGQHLGWFSNGAIWDHTGYAACAERQLLMTVPQIEPVKGVQQVTPVKAVEQVAPVEPVLMDTFGDSSCESLLAPGAE